MKFSQYNDERLVIMTRAGEHRAFEELYNRYWEELYWNAFQRLDDEFVSESLVQEVFIDVYLKIDRLYIEQSLKPYLYRVLKNKVIDEIRRRITEQSYRMAAQHPQHLHSNDVQEKVECNDFREQLSRFTNTLPKKCREVFLLKQKEFSNKEIAAYLNISEKTVEGHVSRARRRVQRYFNSATGALFSALFIFF